MNKIYSSFCKIGGFSSPPEFSPNLTSTVKSDTNRETKGSFLNNIPSPLISLCSLLVHMVGIDVYPNSHLSFPSSQNYNKNSIDNNTIITSKVLLLTRQWGEISA